MKYKLYISLVLDSVCEVYEISEDELTSGNIVREISEARRIAAALIAASGLGRERIASILKFASTSGVTKSIRQHEEALASTSAQYNIYCSVYVEVIKVLNKRIIATYTRESGIQPFPIPDFSHKELLRHNPDYRDKPGT